MVKIIIILLLLFSCQAKKEVKRPKEPTIEITQEQLIVILKTGFLRGVVAGKISNSFKNVEAMWFKDSLEISQTFFK